MISVILFGCLTGIFGCANSQLDWHVSPQIRKVKFKEVFSLYPAETVQTEDGKMQVRLKTIGRKISESGETEYVELQIWSNKTERILVISERGNSAKTVGSYIIKLLNAESFGKTHCQLKISRKN